MKRFLSASVAALALLLTTGVGARASSISPDTVSWTYNFSPGAPAVTADGNPSAGVTFTNEPTKIATGSSDIVATNLRVFSTASASSPDVLTSNGAYTLTLALSANDGSGVQNASLMFTGNKLSGTLSSNSANVTNMFGANATQSVTMGSLTFTVALNSYTPPGPPDQTNSGSISAHVTVTTADTPPTPSQITPEPGTLVLSGFALSFFGGAAWRKRRQARAANANSI